MANPLAWGLETAQKIGIKTLGSGKMLMKKLGSEVTEETAESISKEIGQEVGEKLRAVDLKQEARRNTSKAYKKGYKSGVKEARNPTPPAAAAIEEPVTSWTYRQRVVDGKEVFEKVQTGKGWDKATTVDGREYVDARRATHSKTAEFEYSASPSSDNLPAVIAEENSKSGAGWWSGIGQFVEDHPGIAAAIAGGTGVAGGALLFGGSSEDGDDY